MMKTSTSEKNLIEFSFEGDCLQALQQFAHPSKSGSEEQVKVDLRRTYGLTIGKWSYVMPAKNSAIQTPACIEPDPEEVFFNRIKRLDKKFQDFILLNFHQGGMFYAGRQFLTFHLNSLGFMPSSFDGHKHHFICDFDNPDELVIIEKFNITALDFISDSSLLHKVIVEDEKFSLIYLEQADKDKILYFQENIIKLLSDKASSSSHQSNLRLEKKFKDENEKNQLVSNSDESVNQIEFTVKHTVSLDPTSPIGVKIKKLAKEDIEFKVQAELYELNSATSEPEFSKLLSPNLACVFSGFFKKPNTKGKLENLILNSLQAFILLLFKILFRFCCPKALPEKATFVAEVLASEPQNSFAYRMRA